MDSLSEEELRLIVARQMEAAQCCVCLEPLRPSVVVCVRGHGVCQPCRLRLANCPICKQPFSPDKPILLAQLLDTLPHECQHKGCSYFVRAGDDHEAWCGHIRSSCKKCDWIGSGESVLDHVKEEHSKLHIFKEKNYCRLENFDPEEEICDFVPFYVHGQFFWGECSIDLRKQCLSLRYHLVRNGKVDRDVYVVVQMKNSTMHNTYKLKLCMDQVKPKDNVISIGLSGLNAFVDKHNNLCYQVDFVLGNSLG
ncbi:E3 ubiquitin-protein ligase Siah2-like [Macrosteles quadrilineatus]|uniref:E3 ubiquitin-protein ligase Siah2-like n=1 Tax=Macrosteles quadrilineatus TaxID=74068 RepID=UPI0023E188D9|nr:E3 ubiquitin-protein ligase Siah2-like [Macrosteles quadrilineatus]